MKTDQDATQTAVAGSLGPVVILLYCDDCGKKRSRWAAGPGRDNTGQPRERCNCNCGGQWVSHWAHMSRRKRHNDMKKGDRVKIKILDQGGPIVNQGSVWRVGAGVVAICVDMKSKRCSAGGSGVEDGAPMLVIGGKGALYLKKGKEKQDTVIYFPEFKGWIVWCSEISRYTLAICLVKL